MDTITQNLVSVIYQAPGNLYWKDCGGRYLGCNQAILDIFGLKSHEIIGKTDRELLKDQLSEEKISLIEQTDQLVIRTGKEKILEEEGIDKKGNRAFFLSKKIPLYNDNRKIIGVIGTSIDITKQKQAEIRDFIISQVPCNLYWKDTKGKYLGCNQEFAKILKLNTPEEIIGKDDYAFYLESAHVKEITKIDKKVMTSGKSFVIEELGTGADGKHAIYMTKKTPLKNKEGSIVGIIGASVDVTKEKQAEIAKNEFISSMAHDIRTPFFGLRTLLGAIYDKEEDQNKKEMLGYVVQSAEHLRKLLGQVLELSKLGSLPVEESVFNLREIMEEIVELMKPTLKVKNNTLNVHCSDISVTTDLNRIRRILMNLVGNAVKFTDGGEIDIFVEAEPKLSIAIRDSGVGIENDKLDVIFDKFYRIPASYLEPEFNGSGIGLYAARQLAREIGGDIYVESTPGQGSCFTLKLT